MKLNARAGLLYFVLGQGVWFACVLSAAHHRPLVGMAVATLLIGAHLLRVRDPWTQFRLIAIVACAGGVWETIVLSTGILAYPQESVAFGIFPFWLVALWAAFAAQINECYAWLKGHPAWSAMMGAVFGPLSFRAGAALGALTFVDPWRAVALLAAGWAILLPGIVWLFQRENGWTRGKPVTARGSSSALAFLLLSVTAVRSRAETIEVLHPQGWAHGFVEVTTTAGKRIGVGDLLQRTKGGIVTSRLVLNLFDGSLDEETTTYSQDGQFRLIKDHHIQHGPSFAKPVDVTVDAKSQMVVTRDESGHSTEEPFEMPPDVYNGMASTLLMNLRDDVSQATVAIVIVAKKPRIAHLKISRLPKKPFTLGAKSRRQATEFAVHVDLGGVVSAVASVIGKQPPDYHVLILTGGDPAFIREEGPLYEEGPIWRVQQISAVIP